MKHGVLIGFLALAIFFSFDALVLAELDESEQTMFRLINEYRQQHGLSAVVVSSALNSAATFHSSWMANRNCFSHQCGLEPDFGQRLLNANYRWQWGAGENIAAGRSSAFRIFQLWVNSPSHNQTMLDPRWRAVGISRVYNSSSRYRWYWTVDFGDVVDNTHSSEAQAAGVAAALIPSSNEPLTLSATHIEMTTNGVTFSPQGLGILGARIQMFDLFGNVVWDSGMTNPQALRWNLLNQNGFRIPNGTYLYVVSVRGDQNQVLQSGAKKLVVLN